MKAHVIILNNPNTGAMISMRLFLSQSDASAYFAKLEDEGKHKDAIWGKADIEGFECYLESHYEITAAIERAEDKALMEEDINLFDGMGSKWQAAQEFTTEFERTNQARQWDGEWHDELEQYMANKIKKQYEIAESK
jgi:hypothetical protein